MMANTTLRTDNGHLLPITHKTCQTTNKLKKFARKWVLPVVLFPSREVLHVSLHYLRVISACADGKIRIYNFLNGNCLKVIKTNARGDPVLSFFFQGNRWVVSVEVRTVGNCVGFCFFFPPLGH